MVSQNILHDAQGLFENPVIELLSVKLN